MFTVFLLLVPCQVASSQDAAEVQRIRQQKVTTVQRVLQLARSKSELTRRQAFELMARLRYVGFVPACFTLVDWSPADPLSDRFSSKFPAAGALVRIGVPAATFIHHNLNQKLKAKTLDRLSEVLVRIDRDKEIALRRLELERKRIQDLGQRELHELEIRNFEELRKRISKTAYEYRFLED